jgi:hypothetical protein
VARKSGSSISSSAGRVRASSVCSWMDRGTTTPLPRQCQEVTSGNCTRRGLAGASVPTIGFAIVGVVGDWDIYLTSEVATWLEGLQASDAKTADLVDDAIYALSRSGPALGRPLVDTITASKIKNLKELRPGSSGTSEIRILFVFDPWRSAILLVAGDKAGKWNRWYAEAIPRAEQLYEIYLKERAEEEKER